MSEKSFDKFRFYMRTTYPTPSGAFESTQSSKQYTTSYKEYIDQELRLYKRKLEHMGCDPELIEQAIEAMRKAYESAPI